MGFNSAFKGLKVILESELNVIYAFTAIGTLTIRISKTSFYIINWKLQEMQKFGRKSRNIQEL